MCSTPDCTLIAAEQGLFERYRTKLAKFRAKLAKLAKLASKLSKFWSETGETGKTGKIFGRNWRNWPKSEIVQISHFECVLQTLLSNVRMFSIRTLKGRQDARTLVYIPSIRRDL